MNCGRFLLLLEAGDTGSLDPTALAHATACELCGRALAEARSLEHALETMFTSGSESVPPDFADRLMVRVEKLPQLRLAPADVARATLAAFATPPIATSAAAAAALLGLAALADFDLRRITAGAVAAASPLARLIDQISHPLPAAGLAHDAAVAGLLIAVLPLLAVLVGAAWQLGTLIGERTPRAL